ncbi:hypothetical protein TruAng_008529 [Truncatella angustata]|nr:hypothetical protein TruAng_008529 [Truncatella angustata]
MDSTVRSQQLLQTLEWGTAICDYIQHVSINVRGISSAEVFHQLFFWLPKVHTIDLKNYDAWDTEPWDENNQYDVQGSPVKVLRLVECGAHEDPLHEILSFPSALRELWYDVVQIEWSGHWGDTAPVDFSCAAIKRSLGHQIHSLEKLVFTRPRQDHEGFGYNDQLDISDLTALRSLCINQVFLVGYHSDLNIREHMPSSLEELDVFFDDAGYLSFLSHDAPAPVWLFGLLKQPRDEKNSNRPSFTPELKRLRIVSQEWWPEYSEESEGESMSEGHDVGNDDLSLDESRLRTNADYPWKPPRVLLRALSQSNLAKLSWCIYLHGSRRCSYVPEGGSGFTTEWEESWDPEERIIV